MQRSPQHVDRWQATVTPDTEGPWQFEVHGWGDPVATWHHHAEVKVPAGVDVELVFTEGALLMKRIAATVPDKAQRQRVLDTVTALRDTGRPVEARLAEGLAPEVGAVLDAHPVRELHTVAGPFPFFADRQRALYGSWYEFFPRSEGATVREDGTVVSGTFQTAAKRLDAVAAMGFDIIYLPPIHPIGEVNRKGRNSAQFPGGDPDHVEPNDVGVPWAIGSAAGGHDAIHPDLGTFDDFDAFVAHARNVGLEVALDLALQAAPEIGRAHV